MKIARLHLIAYGPFTDLQLDFTAGHHGLHLVYGPNEAGKSSCLRAITALLFGIDAQTPDNFRHDYRRLRIAAELLGPAGQRVAVTRRKGNKQTLRDGADDAVVDEGILGRLLGGIDRSVFQTRFGINHEQLVRGGHEIVHGGGDIGEILFAAGAGLANFASIRQGLLDQCRELFAPTGRKPPLNEALGKLKQARQALRQAQLRPEQWQQHQQTLQAAQVSRQQVETERAELVANAGRLKQMSEALKLLPQYRSRQAELQQLADVPLLREDFSAQRIAVQTKLRQAESSVRELNAKLGQLVEQTQKLDQPPELLAAARELQDWLDEYAAERQAARQLPELKQQAGQLQRQLQSLLDKLGHTDDQTAPALRTADEARIQNLAAQHGSLAAHHHSARQRLKTLRSQLNQARQRLDRHVVVPQTTRLRQAVKRAEKQGDLESRQLELRRLNDARQAKWLTKLRSLAGLGEAAAGQLGSLSLPARETILRFKEDWQLIDDQQREIKKDLASATSRQQEVDQALQAIQLGHDVPSEADLLRARRRRDDAWDQVKLQQAAHAEQLGAYEQLVRAADELADRLRREASAVANKAGLQAERETLRRRGETLRGKLQDASGRRDQLSQQWASLWTFLDEPPLPPREMLAWHDTFQQLRDDATDFEQQQRQRQQLESQIAELKAALLAELEPDADSGASPAMGLSDLIDLANETLEQWTEARRQRERFERDRERLADELRQQQQIVDQVEEALEQWRQQWQAALAPLNLGDDALPDVARAVLGDLKQVERLRDDQTSLAEQIAQIEQDAESYREEGRRLIRLVAPDLIGRDLDDWVFELRRRLKAATEAQVELKKVEEQVEERQKELDNARQTVREQRATLDALCAEAGCEDDAELPQREQDSARRRELEQRRRATEDTLRAHAGAEPLATFLADAEQLDPAEIPRQQQQLEERLQGLSDHSGQLLEQILREQDWLAQHDGTAEAAEATIEVEHQLAEIEQLAARYARLRLASAVLSRAVEDYRKANESTLLRRAGERFSRLTLRRFDSLQPDLENNRLLAVRRGTAEDEPIGVEAMSEGTADQLYLALRLAALEEHYGRPDQAAVPFIVDDILNRYDDARAVAALQALAELSGSAQVIFFTHHWHLVELANAHLDAKTLFVHRLDADKQGEAQ